MTWDSSTSTSGRRHRLHEGHVGSGHGRATRTPCGKFEEQFALTQGATSHSVQHVLYKPRRAPVVPGRSTSWPTAEQQAEGAKASPKLLINDPLGRHASSRACAASGDFDDRDRADLPRRHTTTRRTTTASSSRRARSGPADLRQPFAVLGEGAGVGELQRHDPVQGRHRQGDRAEARRPARSWWATCSSRIDVPVVPDLVD